MYSSRYIFLGIISDRDPLVNDPPGAGGRSVVLVHAEGG